MITRLDACKLLLDGKKIQYSSDGSRWCDFSVSSFLPSSVLFNTKENFYFRERIHEYKFVTFDLTNVDLMFNRELDTSVYEYIDENDTRYISSVRDFDLNLLKCDWRKFGCWEEV